MNMSTVTVELKYTLKVADDKQIWKYELLDADGTCEELFETPEGAARYISDMLSDFGFVGAEIDIDGRIY